MNAIEACNFKPFFVAIQPVQVILLCTMTSGGRERKMTTCTIMEMYTNILLLSFML